jgi:hypothetical protein
VSSGACILIDLFVGCNDFCWQRAEVWGEGNSISGRRLSLGSTVRAICILIDLANVLTQCRYRWRSDEWTMCSTSPPSYSAIHSRIPRGHRQRSGFPRLVMISGRGLLKISSDYYAIGARAADGAAQNMIDMRNECGRSPDQYGFPPAISRLYNTLIPFCRRLCPNGIFLITKFLRASECRSESQTRPKGNLTNKRCKRCLGCAHKTLKNEITTRGEFETC